MRRTREQPSAAGSQPPEDWRAEYEEGDKAAAAAGALVTQGFVGLRSAIPRETASTLADYLDEELIRRKQECTARADGQHVYASERWFGAVRDRRNRYDMRLGIAAPPVRAALRSLCSSISPVLEELVTLDALVVELSSLIAEPGAIRQPWHPDSLLPSLVGTPLYTCFIALQDTDPSMGPTRLLPRTHTEECHRRLRNEGALGRRARQQAEALDRHMACAAGDAFLMDSRLWHCGGSNHSARRRRLFYVTFGVPHAIPRGSTFSILDEQRNRLRLRHYRSWTQVDPAEEVHTQHSRGEEVHTRHSRGEEVHTRHSHGEEEAGCRSTRSDPSASSDDEQSQEDQGRIAEARARAYAKRAERQMRMRGLDVTPVARGGVVSSEVLPRTLVSALRADAFALEVSGEFTPSGLSTAARPASQQGFGVVDRCVCAMTPGLGGDRTVRGEFARYLDALRDAVGTALGRSLLCAEQYYSIHRPGASLPRHMDERHEVLKPAHRGWASSHRRSVSWLFYLSGEMHEGGELRAYCREVPSGTNGVGSHEGNLQVGGGSA